jgi:hypothetical protein
MRRHRKEGTGIKAWKYGSVLCLGVMFGLARLLQADTVTINGTVSNAFSGLSASTGTISASDTLVQSFNKLANARVVQVLTFSTTSFVSTSSATYQSTNLSATITPKSSTNRIFVLATAVAATVHDGDSGYYTIFRNGSNLVNDQLSDAFYSSSLGPTGNGEWDNFMMLVYLDSPNSTSAQTYTVKLRHAINGGGGSVFWGNGEPEMMVLAELGQ